MGIPITYYFEITCFLVGIIAANLVLRRNPKYLPNRFLALAMFLIGFYEFCIFIYDAIDQEWAVFVFLRIGMIAVLFGDMFIYFTMRCMVDSTKWLDDKLKWVPFVIIVVGISIYFAIGNYINVEAGEVGNVDVHIGYLPMALMGGTMLFFTTFSIIYLQFYGVKKSEGNHRKKMLIFEIGLYVSLFSLFIITASQFLSDSLGILFDVLGLLILSIAMVVFSLGFLLKN
ncbi:MAG: hypothetical protein ACTSVU_09105 [Promethearchaeota archaeon]